jgi:hypothetical protein
LNRLAAKLIGPCASLPTLTLYGKFGAGDKVPGVNVPFKGFII